MKKKTDASNESKSKLADDEYSDNNTEVMILKTSNTNVGFG